MDSYIDDIMKIRFETSRFKRPGYDQDSVDNFLDEVVEYLRAVKAKSTKESADSKFFIVPNFPRTRWREGYDIEEVNEFIAEVQEWLREVNDSQAKRRESGI